MLSMKVSMELTGGFLWLGVVSWSDACSEQHESCAHHWAHLGHFLHDKHPS